MTNEQFTVWIESHAAMFGDGCYKYLEASEAFSAWKKILGEYDYDDASEASVKMLSGELEEWRAFNEHPKILKEYCRQAKSARARIASAPEPGFIKAVRCLRCRDTGYAHVWSTKTITEIKKGTKDIPLYSCHIPCNCDKGKERCWKDERQFQVGVDAPILPMVRMADQLPELMEFLENRKKPERPKYEEFEKYSGATMQ